MTDMNLIVKDSLVVSLDYTLRLDDGEVIDTSSGREPLEFLQGKGQIIPGLEQALYGMAIGDKKKVKIVPRDGYGERDDDAYEVVAHDVFPSDMKLTLGMGLRMRDKETDESLEAYVAEVSKDGVLLDFNHPLAGETLFFNVEVVGLRPATDEELSNGHVHDAED